MAFYEPLRYRAREASSPFFEGGNVGLQIEVDIGEYLAQQCIPHKVYPMAQLGATGVQELSLILKIASQVFTWYKKQKKEKATQRLDSFKPAVHVDLATSVGGVLSVDETRYFPGNLQAHLLSIASGLDAYLKQKYIMRTQSCSTQ